MSDNNVVEFPGGLTQKEVEQKAADGMIEMVKAVEKNRVEGQERLEKQLTRIKDMREAGRSVDTLLEETETALSAALTSIEALNQFCDMIKQDLVGMVQNLENQAMGGYSTSLHLEALMSVMLSKGGISDEEMSAAFKQAQARMQAQIAQAQQPTPGS